MTIAILIAVINRAKLFLTTTAMKKVITSIILICFLVHANAQSCLPGGIAFNCQAQIDSFSILYPNCSEIEGCVAIGCGAGTDIVNLDGLRQLTSIGSFLHIYRNDSLQDLSGLQNLKHIHGDLIIGTVLYGGYWGNRSLIDLSGLEGLDSIYGRVVILGNEKLENFNGLENLRYIEGAISIQANGSLSSLVGLENIASGSITELYIINNCCLSTCDIQSVCEYLQGPDINVSIHGNAEGCFSPEEAAMACGLGIHDHDIVNKQFRLYPNPASTTFTLELNSHPSANSELIIYGSHGLCIGSFSIREQRTMIDVSGLTPGLYFVNVIGNEKVMVGKFVKK